CDLFVGIIGHVHGSCPDGSEQSYTEREYEAAREGGIPRLMLIAPDDFPVPGNLREPQEKWEKQRAFRSRVGGERIRNSFSDPQDLATKAVAALGYWEWEQAEQGGDATDEREPRQYTPFPPTPYFVHPYPLQVNFTGRACERQTLSGWLAGSDQAVFALIGIGGMGKSALTWAWANRDVLGLPLPGQPADPSDRADACRVPEGARPDGVLWWSFYESGAGFGNFVNTAIAYASGGEIDPAQIPSLDEKTRVLLRLLQRRRILLVLDGLERILNAYTRLDAAYQGDDVTEDTQQTFRACSDPHAANFLAWLANTAMESRVLLTSRLFPRELGQLPGCCRQNLHEFDPEDAIAFFHAQGIQGTRAEIQHELDRFGSHPLCLRLLAGAILRDKRSPGDIKAAKRHKVLDKLTGSKRQHHILKVAYDALDKPTRTLLSQIAAFRSPKEYEAVATLNPFKNGEVFDDALDELVERGLLLAEGDPPRYDLHPIVRQYAYDRLTARSRKSVHTRLRDYFDAVPKPSKVESLDDLQPVIELYHHTVRAGRFDDACDLFYERLNDLLYYRFGAYLACIELLRALFPDGEPVTVSGEAALPQLKNENDQAWTLNALANSFGLSGQPRRAVPLFERHNSLRGEAKDKKNHAAGLGNLAYQQVMVGELAAVEASLRRRIDLCREIEDEFREGVGHRELGRLLSYEGDFAQAASELDAALAGLEKQGHTQTKGITWAYRALRALLTGDARKAAAAAQRARELAEQCVQQSKPNPRDIVEAEWLLGWANVAIAAVEPRQHDALLAEAERHLTDALTRCRRINAVEVEPDILLAWARWHRLMGHRDEAKSHAQEALAIADRCEFRLKQADIHNFLAQLALDAGDRQAALDHARTARERAECDGEPHWYKPAIDEAERLLREAGAAPPQEAEEQ
ncbi:hypothetical protein HQ576_12835, partial [bacterium]|nr:hypothetical protein [bacterium]